MFNDKEVEMIIATILGFFIWYIYYGFECFLNGGTLGRNQYTMHFHLAWQELTWVLPGGRKRKGRYVKDNVIGDIENGHILGCPWSYKEIRQHNLYEAAANKILPGLPHFLFTHILLPFLPLIFYFIFYRT